MQAKRYFTDSPWFLAVAVSSVQCSSYLLLQFHIHLLQGYVFTSVNNICAEVDGILDSEAVSYTHLFWTTSD